MSVSTRLLSLAALTALAGLSMAGSPLRADVRSPVRADVRDGVIAWEAGDFARAIAEWRPLAIAGNADAAYNMGQAYKLGRGVPVDLAQAANWFRIAARGGHGPASDSYGLILFQMNRQREALPWVEQSAARGEPRAQYILGTAYFNGDLVGKDWVRAYAYTMRASQQGLRVASERLVELDRYVPAEQRQQGTMLAQAMGPDEAAARAAFAAVSGNGHTGTLVPASQAAVDAPLPGRQAHRSTAKKPSAPTANPVHIAAMADTPQSRAPASKASAAPLVAGTARVASGGAWRAQLAAPANTAGARNLWANIVRRGGVGNARSYVIDMGHFVRLRAGDFSSRAEAAAFCRTMAARAQSCFVVAPGS